MMPPPFQLRYLLGILFVLGSVIQGFHIRPAMDEDVSYARKILLQQAMNPFSLSRENLLVACEEREESTSILGFGQIRPLDDQYSELASLFVVPERRRSGIGGAIVKALLERHVSSSQSPRALCLLTLRPTTSFYEPFGFHAASESERKALPKSFQFEFQAGNALSFVLGNDLVCMTLQNSNKNE